MVKAPMHLVPVAGVVGNLTRILWQVEARNFKPRRGKEGEETEMEALKGSESGYFQIPPHHKVVLQMARYIIRLKKEEHEATKGGVMEE